ncbi:MAG: ABC transporter substrate-binding protein [Elainellaceae cyanobacterium]
MAARCVKQWIRGVVAIATIALLPGCQASSPLFADQPLQAGETLKIGALLPESGPYSPVSLPIVNALLLMRDTVNACGGVNQAPVSLAFYDHEVNRQTEVAGIKYLVNQAGVHAIVAALSEPVSSDVLAIALDRNVSVISPTATTTLHKRHASPEGWAQLDFTEVQQARALAKLAVSQGWERANLLISDTDKGQRFAQTFIQIFESRGGTVVNGDAPVRAPSDPPTDAERSRPRLSLNPSPESEQPASPSSEDLSSLLRDVDVLVADLDGRRGYDLLQTAIEQRQAQGQGQLPILLSHNVALTAFGEGRWQRINPSQPYVFGGAMGLMPAVNTDILQALKARWQGTEALQWGEYAPQAWDAAALIVLAAEAAGQNGRIGIRTNFKQVANPSGVRVTQVCEGLAHLRRGVMINYQGASGTVDLGTNGQLAVTSQYRRWQILDSGQIRWGDSTTLE